MTAVVLESYSGAEGLRVEQRPVPEPGANQVLVKIAASPINPSDLAFLNGRYGFKSPPPVVPGQEGSGTVVAVGPGLWARWLLGKRVACLWGGEGDGVWAEYAVVSAKGGALPLHTSVSLEQGAMSAVNPLAASAFLEIAKEGGHTSFVLTAAAGVLGQMVNRLGMSEGVQVINVVRRDTQVELLKELGATIVLNSSEEGFDQRLREACLQQGTHLALDAVSGPMTGQLLQALPRRSRVTVFGGLSSTAVHLDPTRFIFEEKSVDGFWLGPWIASRRALQVLRMWRRAQSLIRTDLRSHVRARYPLREAKRAVGDYVGQMTGGKVLLRPGES